MGIARATSSRREQALLPHMIARGAGFTEARCGGPEGAKRPCGVAPGWCRGLASYARIRRIAVLEASVAAGAGAVLWWSEMKGYGFITPDDGGAPVFVRRSEFVDYREHGIKVRDGELVSYDVVIGEGRDLERNEAVPEARNVHPLGGLKLRLRTENEPTFDVEAAGLRADGADLLVAIEALARKLEHALPHATKVRRRSTRPFSKNKRVARVVVKLGWTRYRLSHHGRRYRRTRGFPLRRHVRLRQLELTDWVDALTADLRERAWANGHLRANLARLVA